MKPIKIILAMTLGSLGMAVHAADTFKIDPVHSSVVFSVTYLGTNFYGRFNDVKGTVGFRQGRPVEELSRTHHTCRERGHAQ